MAVPIFLVVQGNRVIAAEICSSESAAQDKFKEENLARDHEPTAEELSAGVVELQGVTFQLIKPMSDYQQLADSFDSLPLTWLPGLLNRLVAAAIERPGWSGRFRR